MALLAAMAGIVFQINTLSFVYHSVLWMFFGLVGAWYSAVRHHMPDVRHQDHGCATSSASSIAALLYAVVVLPVYLKAKGFM